MIDSELGNEFQPDEEARLETGIGRSKWFEMDRQRLLPTPVFIGRKKLRVKREMRDFRAKLIAERDAEAGDG